MSAEEQRWQLAQKYEKAWWNARRDKINLAFYKEYAAELFNHLAGILTIGKETAILEIGSAAAGIITFLPSDQRYAVEPLEDYFSSIENFKNFRDKQVHYKSARAEALPFEDNKFDLVIIDNVLDHCDDVDATFQEMQRVLKPGGKIYLKVNVYTNWGRLVRSLAERAGIDPGHPHTFTKQSVANKLADHDLKVIRVDKRGWGATWIREIGSGEIRQWLKAITFSSPRKTLYILEK